MKRPVIFLLILLSLLGVIAYSFAQTRLQQADVRRFAEDWASQILKARVKIGKIIYLPPARIALKDLQVTRTGTTPSEFSVASVKKLVLGYGLFNLIRGDFSVPGTAKIQSPEIHFASSSHSPLPFFDSDTSSKVPPVKLIIEGGEFHYPLGPHKELILSKVYLKASPDVSGKIRLKLKAFLKGSAHGELEVSGVTDPAFHHYELEIHLQEVGFVPEVGIPLQKLSGNFRISEDLIQIAGVTNLIHDWEIQWHGKIEHWQNDPKISVEIGRKKGKPPFSLSLAADLASQKLTGMGTWAGASYPFNGNLRREGKKIIFPALRLAHEYRGKGTIDFSNGNYDFWFERQRRRFHLRSNLNHLEFETEFQLDHASINHLDWVVLGSAHIAPLERKKGRSGPQFKVQIQTEYVIVQFQPLQDFQGSFEISAEGIEAINFKWGEVFYLEGRVLFRGGESREDLLMGVQGYPLEMIKEFSGRPMPNNLRGMLEGKLKLRGQVAKPEIQGHFTIKDGMIEKLDFDRAVIEFRGFPPQLRLFDSKVFRGRNTLQMTGVVDLRLENLFHGIRIQRSDHLVIWKGMSVYWKEGKSAVEGEKPLNKKVSMAFEVGAGVPPNSNSEDQGDERHAILGPKLKF